MRGCRPYRHSRSLFSGASGRERRNYCQRVGRASHVFARLITLLEEPLFFVLEAGTHRDEERRLRKKDSDPFHKDVWYLDNISMKEAVRIWRENEDLLNHDGMVNFGIGSKSEEVLVGAYKLLSVYTASPSRFRTALRELGFLEESRLKTVWDNITAECPGSRTVLEKDGKTIWRLISELQERGLYLAERRPC